MAVAGTITLVWKMKLADMVAKHAAPLGAGFLSLHWLLAHYGKRHVGYLVGMDRCEISINVISVLLLLSVSLFARQ